MRSSLAFLIPVLAAVTHQPCAAAESDGKTVDALVHFLVVWDKDAYQLTPTDAGSKLEKGQRRLSCRALRVERQGDQAVVVFVDAVLESDESRVVAKEISVGSNPFALRFDQGRLKFKTKEAETRFREENNLQKGDPTEEGMKASEVEHWERWLNRLRDAHSKDP